MRIIFEETNVDVRPERLWFVTDLVEDCKDNSLDMVYKNIKTFLGDSSPFIVGRGGHHIWIALKSSQERLILITE